MKIDSVFIVSFQGKTQYIKTPQIVKAILMLEPQAVIKRTIKTHN